MRAIFPTLLEKDIIKLQSMQFEEKSHHSGSELLAEFKISNAMCLILLLCKCLLLLSENIYAFRLDISLFGFGFLIVHWLHMQSVLAVPSQ